MRQPYRKWTREEIEKAAELYAKHRNYKRVARIMGRDDSMIRGYLKGQYVGPYRDFLFTRDPRDIPPSVIDDRDRRAQLAPRDLTAAFFGDPLPGMSALERR